MKRLWIATALALGFHGMLLILDFPGPVHKRQPDAVFKPVELALMNETPRLPTTAPPVHQPEKVSEPLPASQPVLQPKPLPKAIPNVRKSPVPLKTPKPVPKILQKEPGPAEIVPNTQDVPASLPLRRAQAQPEKTLSEGEPVDQFASQSLISEAVPLYDRNPPPRYPQQARKRGFQGRVILKVLVGKDGRVADIGLQESSGHSILDNAALETVRDWAFTPGRRGESSVEMWIRVPMLFELK